MIQDEYLSKPPHASAAFYSVFWEHQAYYVNGTGLDLTQQISGLTNDPTIDRTTHRDIFLSCLTLMLTSLRRDTCNLQRPGVLSREIDDTITRQHLSPDLQYACSNWVYHLKECQTEVNSHVGDRLLKFFHTNFLHWLEALSLMQKIPTGLLALGMLQNIITVSFFAALPNHCI